MNEVAFQRVCRAEARRTRVTTFNRAKILFLRVVKEADCRAEARPTRVTTFHGAKTRVSRVVKRARRRTSAAQPEGRADNGALSDDVKGVRSDERNRGRAAVHEPAGRPPADCRAEARPAKGLMHILGHAQQVLPVAVFAQRFRQRDQGLLVDVTHVVGDLFRTGNLQPLAFLDRFNKH